MKNKIQLLIVLFCVSLMTPAAFGATITRVKGSKAQVRMKPGELSKGDRVLIYDGADDEAGEAKVYKVKRRKAYIRKISGTLRKGFTVEVGSSGGGSAGGSALKGYLGLAFVDGLNSNPMTFGGDYRFKKGTLSFLKDWHVMGGFLYWSTQVLGLDFSILELSGGIERDLTRFGKIQLNWGGRFGYATATVSTTSIFGTTSRSEGNLFFAPHIAAAYPLGKNLSVGGELRIPYYLDDYYDFFDIFYSLAFIEYRM